MRVAPFAKRGAGPAPPLPAETRWPLDPDRETQNRERCFAALTLRRLWGELERLKGRAGADDLGATLLEIQRVTKRIQELPAGNP